MLQLLGFGSGLMLAMAYFFEYGMGLHPCTMCYWQRIPHGVVLAFGVLAVLPVLFTVTLPSRLMLAAVMLALLIGAVIAAWHSGVELNILPGPTACSGGVALDGSPAALLDQLLAAPVVRCDDIPWSFLGLSMANWNMIITASMAVIAAINLAKGDTAQS